MTCDCSDDIGLTDRVWVGMEATSSGGSAQWHDGTPYVDYSNYELNLLGLQLIQERPQRTS